MDVSDITAPSPLVNPEAATADEVAASIEYVHILSERKRVFGHIDSDSIARGEAEKLHVC